MITCFFENKNEAQLRHVVADGLIIKENKILLVKRAEWLLEGGKYALPGGYMDRNEVIHETVVREALEETGWKCKIQQFFAVVDDPERGDDRQNVGFIFILDPVEEVRKPDNESSAVEWFDIDNLPEPLAFDHQRILDAYKKYKKEMTPLPVFLS